jgi:hypothetical protein
MLKQFINKDIISLRNFHYINKNNTKWFKIILLNLKLRNFFLFVLNYLSFIKFFNKLAKRYKSKLFHYPISFSNKDKIFFIDYGLNARPSFVLKTNQVLKLNKTLVNEDQLCFGLSFLENFTALEKTFNEYDFIVNLKIYDSNKELLKKLKYSLPLGKKKHALSKNQVGSSWFDFSVSLSDYKNKKITTEIFIELIKKSFTFRECNQLTSFSENTKIFKENIFSLSAPFYKKKEDTKKILLISGESLTDPFYMEKFYNKKIKLNNLRKLRDDSNYIQRAYSVADSTLPNIPSLLTGLLPSQHGFGDYKLPMNEKILSNNIKTLPELLDKKFISSFINCYPRFDHLQGWGRNVHNYFTTDGPWHDYSPDSKTIIDNFEYYNGTNTFIYCHIDKLHLPIIHNYKKNFFEINSSENLSSSFEGDFLNHYCEHLEKFDLEIGIIVNYLQNTHQYENTKIIITGDHGIAMPPKWNTDGFKGMEYSHYDEHSRVPLIIKNANWDESKFISLEQTGAQYYIFKNILDSTGTEMPNYFKNLPQFKNFNDFSISETVYHPENNNYSVCISSKDFKFWKLMKIDWKNKKLIENIKTRIFKIDSNGFEKEIKINSSLENEIKKFNFIIEDIIKNGLEFQKKYI